MRRSRLLSGAGAGQNALVGQSLGAQNSDSQPGVIHAPQSPFVRRETPVETLAFARVCWRHGGILSLG